MDFLSGLGSIGTLAALVFAGLSVRQAAQSRNLTATIELSRQITAERDRAQSLNLFGMSDREFHAFQMLQLVEQACFIVNHGMITGRASEFMCDWLEGEIRSIETQEIYRAFLRNLEPGQLTEYVSFRRKSLHWHKVLDADFGPQKSALKHEISHLKALASQ
ncbi:hypothetical protein [Ensifer sp. LC384]|uniref:hypothetical protein n=1 Tax=Ensifer sp. LC384 TaxID=1120653 RepID=UPI001146E82F|nr:hypothetical protein [Ensifer sp. LC384]